MDSVILIVFQSTRLPFCFNFLTMLLKCQGREEVLLFALAETGSLIELPAAASFVCDNFLIRFKCYVCNSDSFLNKTV